MALPQLAIVIALPALLFGIAAVDAAWAEDAASVSNRHDAFPTESSKIVQQQGGSDEGKAGAGGKGDSGTSNHRGTKAESEITESAGKGSADGKGALDSDGANTEEHAADSRGIAKGDGQADTKGQSRTEKNAGGKQGEAAFGSIDTRVTVVARPRHARRLKDDDVRKPKLARQSGNSQEPRRSLARAAKKAAVRNTIGLAIERADAGKKANDLKILEHDIVRDRNGDEGGARLDTPRLGFVPVPATGAAHGMSIYVSGNRSIIDGRDMIRRPAGSGMIGGPAKNVAAVINGAKFRPGHP